MEHMSMPLTGAWSVLNVLANLVIVAGYVLVPFTVLKYLPLTPSVRWAGFFFFVTCATTHLSMALGFSGSEWMVVNHVVQAVSVIWFVVGFWLLLRAALERAAKRRHE